MPVVTTGARALAASAGRSPAKGLITSLAAGKIPFARRTSYAHTFSMFGGIVPDCGTAARLSIAVLPRPAGLPTGPRPGHGRGSL
jgi:hypothetical protein